MPQSCGQTVKSSQYNHCKGTHETALYYLGFRNMTDIVLGFLICEVHLIS